MVQSKHTPGPWEVVGLSGSGGPFAIRMAYHSDNPNAHKTHYGVQSIRTRENARLIAAAPELLAALKLLSAEEWRDDDDPILMSAREQARAAIAKAEGGAS